MRLTAGMLRRIIQEEVNSARRNRRGLREMGGYRVDPDTGEVFGMEPTGAVPPPPPKSYSSHLDDYNAALRKFADEWGDNSISDIDPEDVAHDIARNFFSEYPEWETWADELDLTQDEILSDATDYVYEAMIS